MKKFDPFFLSYIILSAILFYGGCSVQQDVSNHKKSKWTKIGRESGREVTRIHAKIFEKAAEKKWDDPKRLSDFLLSEIRKEIPNAYKEMGTQLAIELGDDWDEDRVEKILEDLAKGYKQVR